MPPASTDPPAAACPPASDGPSSTPSSPPSKRRRPCDFRPPATWTLGAHLAARLDAIGIAHIFTVPGDFTLPLLDALLVSPLSLISCANELNAGYAADGYARARGAACVVVTYGVGGLSVLNAVAGAYSDHLPVLVISGGINTNDIASSRLIHHTTTVDSRTIQLEMFEKITAFAASITHISSARATIDTGIRMMMKEKRPAYLEIACNLASEPVPAPVPLYALTSAPPSLDALRDAVQAARDRWEKAAKPVIVVGAEARAGEALEEIERLAERAGCAIAVQPNAKGMFRENHPQFVGIYWGPLSSPGCASVVEGSDLYLFVGPIFSDISTAAYTLTLSPSKMMAVRFDRVDMPDGTQFGPVTMKDFLRELASVIPPNKASLDAYHRIMKEVPLPKGRSVETGGPLIARQVMDRIERSLTSDHALIVETGDAWYHSQRFKLPPGCGYELQMQYGSIGWSVGAVLGYSLATAGRKRIIALIGDGAFQMTAQELATVVRYGCDPVVVLLNNKGYTTEVAIHDGPYNVIKNWDYVKLVDAFAAGDRRARARAARTEEEFRACLEEAMAHDGMFLIECSLGREDCAAELVQLGVKFATLNSRKHKTSDEVL